MNTRILTLLATAALAAVACNKASDTTKLVVKFGDTLPAQVHVVLGAKIVDTLIVPQEQVLNLDLPVALATLGRVETDNNIIRFISDGTTVNLDFSGEIASYSGSANSLNGKFKSYMDWNNDFMERYRNALTAIETDSSLSDEDKNAKMDAKYDEMVPEYMEYNKQAAKENADNVIGLNAFQQIYTMLEPEEVLEIAGLMSEELKNDPSIVQVTSSTEAQLKTAEGQMFTDFEVVTDPDTGKKEKLSDYVGKGKYMLVDFWASWCGPCKQEIPNLKEVYNKFHGDNFDMLSVAVWERGNIQASIDTAAAYGINWNHMLNGENVPTDAYGILGIPHIILFGPDGTILKRDLRGAAIGEEVAKYVK